MTQNTKLLSPKELSEAANIIKSGGIVGFPTETVYGLGGNALDPQAVRSIFAAKGRPADNPLIVHLSDFSEAEMYACDIPETAYRLADTFCPGPFTIVLKKKNIIPEVTSGGLDTVGIRVPANNITRKFISLCGTPIAAPSANLSGSPSPTCARHVLDDMDGRIPAVIDGGDCPVGVESTVVCLEENTVKILRPGFVSREDIAAAGFEVTCAAGVTEKLPDGERALSPGMKYKHYAPKADVTILEGSTEKFVGYLNSHLSDNCCAMIFGDMPKELPCPVIDCGRTSEEQARRLFSALREADEIGVDKAYASCPDRQGVGLAVYNRLLRAAAFKVVRL